ncbi:MAG: alpha/beta fold hydrolase [Acidimicrobiales bacterium]
MIPFVDAPVAEPVPGPPLPLGRRVVLAGRGTTFVREVEGPPGAPTVVLLHGWMASGGLNWFRVFEPLGEHFHVVAPDLRGHGRGIRSRRRFRIGDCADDIAALLDVLDTGPVIAVGYSLGGPVAQMLWKRHPEKVQGLVLCATAHTLMPGVREAWVFSTIMAVAAGTTRAGQLASMVPVRGVRRLVSHTAAAANRPSTLRAWAAAEMRRHSGRMVMEAGVAMGNFSSRKWIGGIDIPTTVIVTTKDKAIPPIAQLHMALSIPGSVVQRIEDGHLVCGKPSFAAPILAACLDVSARAKAASLS